MYLETAKVRDIETDKSTHAHTHARMHTEWLIYGETNTDVLIDAQQPCHRLSKYMFNNGTNA